jgi:hypothetical protein
MSYIVTVTLTSSSPFTGPFDIYEEPGHAPLLSNVLKTTLEAGVNVVITNPATTSITVQSDNLICNNSVTIDLSLPVCNTIEIIGTSIVSWSIFGGGTNTFTFTDVTINVCTYTSSITHVGGTVNITSGTDICQDDTDCWPTLNLQAVGIDRFNPRQVTIWGSPYTPNQAIIPWMIDYGDGTQILYTGSKTFNTIDDHIYATPFTGTIKIKAISLELIKSLNCGIAGQSFTTGSVTLIGSELTKLVNLESITNISWNLNSTALQIPTNLDTLYSLRGQITGDIADLPSTLTKISLLGAEANLLSGNIIDLPTGLTLLRIDGLNTIAGNVSTFPGAFDTQIVRIVIGGRNTISGNLSEFSTYTTLVEFDLKGLNTVVGSICNFNSSMQRIVIQGYSSPSGDISCLTGSTALTTLSLENDETLAPPGTGNTVTGDIANLPSSLITITVSGLNTLYGDIMDIPASTTYWIVRGENTITGDIATIPSTCVRFFHGGFSTLYGDIATIHSNFIRFYISFKGGGTSDLSGITGDIHFMPKANLTQFSLYGNHHVNTYSASSVWHPNMNVCIVNPTADRGTYFIPTAELDQLIINLAATSWTVTTSFDNAITLCGTTSGGPAVTLALATLNAIPPPNDILITIAP